MRRRLFVSALIIIVLLFVAVSQKAINKDTDPPDELANFIANTESDGYWGFIATPKLFNLFKYKGGNLVAFSIGFNHENIAKEDNRTNFIDSIYKVSINDNRKDGKIKSWRKPRGREFIGPTINTTTSYKIYNTNKYYNPETNEPVVTLNNIFNYKKMDESFIEGWITYKAKYDLEGAEGGLPIPSEAYQGEVIISINEDNTKMREIYISNNKWVYIRHLEKGEYPREINDDDLDDILENMWWTWEEILQPVVEKAKSKIE